MNKNIRLAKKEVKRILRKSEVGMAYIYGSSLAKKDPYDIDILFVIEDDDFKEENIEKIEKEKEKVYSKYKDCIIHIQPLQPLSQWWRLILKGEPWIIDSLKKPLIIKDSKKILKNASEMVNKGFTFQREETADHLLERSQNCLVEINQDLLKSLIDLSEATTEALGLFLVFQDKVVFNKDKIIKLIEGKYKDKIHPAVIEDYKEIVDLEKKMLNGNLTEFTAENLEHYQEKAQRIISYIEKIIAPKK